MRVCFSLEQQCVTLLYLLEKDCFALLYERVIEVIKQLHNCQDCVMTLYKSFLLHDYTQLKTKQNISSLLFLFVEQLNIVWKQWLCFYVIYMSIAISSTHTDNGHWKYVIHSSSHTNANTHTIRMTRRNWLKTARMKQLSFYLRA